MEAFEHVAKVFLESRGYAVSTNVKFPVRRRTKKQAYKEYQEHGYEVDLVDAGNQYLQFKNGVSLSAGVTPAPDPNLRSSRRSSCRKRSGSRSLTLTRRERLTSKRSVSGSAR